MKGCVREAEVRWMGSRREVAGRGGREVGVTEKGVRNGVGRRMAK